ncbi:MAG: DUF3793 family protein [Bacillota bacterium]
MTLFEKRLAETCGVAMVGIKTSNLMCCKYADYENIHGEIEKIANALESAGIKMTVLHDNGRRILLLVYREKAMKQRLSEDESLKFLQSYGYDTNWGETEMLSHLSTRFDNISTFPHEIGVFLGYPIEDILGFMNDPKGCKYCGVWKVYGNVEENIKLFAKFERCKNAIMKRINNGDNLAKIFAKAC